jgi:divalent metal cation (Fe/Co/Zn/Cd) transporter
VSRRGQPFALPPELDAQRRRAGKMAWLSLVLLTSSTLFLAATLGSSQAMKTAWISDILSIVPPIALLVAMRFELRPPSTRFPYGYTRAIGISFLVTASSLTLMGAWLFVDAVLKLVMQERPPIGTAVYFGHQLWAGWAMIAALAYSIVCGSLVGALKKPIAEKLHDKEQEAQAQLNRDEWLSEGAAILGLLLVGYGHWWGDAGAAAFISVNMIRDGIHNLRQVIADLMDETPTQIGSNELETLPGRLTDAAEALPWVARARVRLREHGRALTGDVYVVPRDDGGLVARLEQASEQLTALDWRLHDLNVVPVARLEPEAPARS